MMHLAVNHPGIFCDWATPDSQVLVTLSQNRAGLLQTNSEIPQTAGVVAGVRRTECTMALLPTTGGHQRKCVYPDGRDNIYDWKSWRS